MYILLHSTSVGIIMDIYVSCVVWSGRCQLFYMLLIYTFELIGIIIIICVYENPHFMIIVCVCVCVFLYQVFHKLAKKLHKKESKSVFVSDVGGTCLYIAG